MDQALTCLIAENSLFIYGKIGNGSFGVVKKGDWTTPSGQKVRYFLWSCGNNDLYHNG
jgi:activated CDC42 kinase 1